LRRGGAARARSGQEAWPLRRAQRIAGDPDELVALARVDGPGVVVVAKSERDAARAVRIDEGLAVIVAIVEADVVAPDRAPGAGLVELIAQRARLVRRGERVLRREPQVADAAALGEQHHRPRAAG